MPRLAVIGHPVAHSRSPAMQTAALEALGLVPEWSYEAIDVAPHELEDLMRRLAGDAEMRGLNVTIPHKQAALSLSDAASERARRIGAANTLSFEGGRIAADNTDAPGLIAALPGPVEGVPSLVLGAGGSARAAVWALLEAGAEVFVHNRTTERAEALASELGAQAIAPEGPGASLPLERFELIVNCTAVGLEPGASGPSGEGGDLKALRLDADSIGERHVVVDLVYGDRPTALQEAAKANGATVIDGFEVLVQQGAESFRIWTGREPPVATMREAARSSRWRPTASDT